VLSEYGAAAGSGGHDDKQRLLVLFVCLFVVIKPKNPCFASRPGLEVKPLGVYQLGPRSSSCGPTKGTPCTETLYVPTWLTLHKLTGWLASLDYASHIQDASSATE